MISAQEVNNIKLKSDRSKEGDTSLKQLIRARSGSPGNRPNMAGKVIKDSK